MGYHRVTELLVALRFTFIEDELLFWAKALEAHKAGAFPRAKPARVFRGLGDQDIGPVLAVARWQGA